MIASTSSACSGAEDGVSFEAEEEAALHELFLEESLTPPSDPSNAYADSSDAAVLGQLFFFETRFSGRLLDADNDGRDSDGDGVEDSLGLVGETGKVSCAGCHVPEAGFLDNRSRGKQISLASRWVLRRTPSLLDVGFRTLLMWDGRRDALYNQVFGVVESPNEMNSSRLYVAKQIWLLYKDQYEAVFGPLPPLDDTARFPDLNAEQTGCELSVGELTNCRGMPGDAAEYDSMSEADRKAVTRVVVNFGRALGAFQRKIRCGTSRFDEWLAGDKEALSVSEQRGAKLFVGKAQCVQCHSGPLFSDNRFHNVGLKPQRVAVAFVDRNDRGAIEGLQQNLEDPLNTLGEFSDGSDDRLPSEVSTEHEGAFLTPMLRCISLRPSFMHTGHITTLEDVVGFFNQGGDSSGFPGQSEIAYLGLEAQERADLVAFLRALDGPGADVSLMNLP